MKRLFLFLILVSALTLPASAQFVSQWTQGVIPLPATPAVCTPGNGQVVFNTALNGLLSCTGVNQWRPVGMQGNQYTIAQGTITTSQPFLNHTATWNAGAVTFSNILSNVTDTASAGASLLMDLQVGGASMFSVRKDGTVTGTTLVATGSAQIAAAGSYVFATRNRILSGADGQLNITDNAGTGLSTLTFGPETNAFVRITPVSVGGVGQGFIFGHGDGTTVVFADLAAATNGTIVYCSDCTKATPCAAAGNGALAKRLNGAWDCD